jgi:predicted PurR-regulated permease PerM
MFKKFLKKLSLPKIQPKKESPKEEVKTTTKGTPSPLIPENRTIVEIEISTRTIVKVLLIIVLFMAGLALVAELKSILITLGMSAFLAIGLTPVLDKIEEHRIPRPIAILILYVFFLGAISLLFIKVVPIIARQLMDIARDLAQFVSNPETSGISIPFLEKFGLRFEMGEIQHLLSNNLAAVSKNLQSVAGSTVGIVGGIFQGVFSFIFTLVLLFFILLEREQIGRFLLALFSDKDHDYIKKKFISVQAKMAKWFRGQLLLMVIIGLFMYVGMKILEYLFGMQYAATIGIFSAFTELLPYIGVWLMGLLAGLIAMNISWTTLLAVIGWIAITQIVENNFLVPIIMEKVVGLSSVVVLVVLMIGGALGFASGGVAMAILGMIFSVPVAASIAIFVQDYVDKKKK